MKIIKPFKLTLILILDLSTFNAIAVAQAPTRIFIALDNSGSMRNQFKPIAQSLDAMKTELTGQAELTDSIKLYSFTDNITLEFEGGATDVFSAISSMEPGGGTEDGLIPIEKIVNDEVDAVSGAATHIILFTDERRLIAAEISKEYTGLPTALVVVGGDPMSGKKSVGEWISFDASQTIAAGRN